MSTNRRRWKHACGLSRRPGGTSQGMTKCCLNSMHCVCREVTSKDASYACAHGAPLAVVRASAAETGPRHICVAWRHRVTASASCGAATRFDYDGFIV